MATLKTVIIDVTQNDIDYGHRFVLSACPIALAAKRAFKCLSVSVAGDGLTVKYEEENIHYEITNEMLEFMRSFDYIGINAVKPTKFKLTI